MTDCKTCTFSKLQLDFCLLHQRCFGWGQQIAVKHQSKSVSFGKLQHCALKGYCNETRKPTFTVSNGCPTNTPAAPAQKR